MLKLTDNATTIVKSIAEQADATGLRIAGDDGPEAAFGVTAVTAALPEDQVVEQDGATVFLDPAAAQQLDNMVLDAGVDGEGNAQFALAAQE